ncbi:M3 family oligoendopeptidase [Fimbriimonas ginsengisoli]|uniref:Oligoendopeptidase F n=1 Tax=Fimbriimonas ginsengisoli Gsoil 348 TaxID=661478 RepID=A0A068NNF3_FIMGI|nr:M3 family oligoendopeptidase [Fimbriimonas ginsengisoli]AIE84991.1 Oligoendopeptidase F [Fimbriimonas ginsengisoli Gsoil 348]
MSTTQEIAPPKVRWDLSALFSGLDDPKIEETWTTAMERADAFAAKYRGKIESADLDAPTLAAAIRDIEALYNEVAKPMGYANLVFSTDSGDPKVGAFMQKQRERGTELSVKTLFFELELQAADGELIDRLLASDELANYRHYVQSTRVYSPYRLSEKEEIILEETANTGSRAWIRLFEELTANHVFKIQMPGEDAKDATEQEVLALLRHENREVRQMAADSLTKGLQEMQRVLVYNFNNLLQDKSVEDRLRKFEYPEQSRHLSNELDRETVDLVVSKCKENYGLVSRFYNVKREILGLPELTHIDRYAPLFPSEGQVGWDRAKEIVLTSFATFSPTLEQRAAEFFDKNWIDAEPRKGKQGGAFCAYNTPDTHPVVFQTYLNKMDDVMTLAHELGHGVHASLSRAQSYLNFHGTLPLAELASTFGEMLVFEKLVADASPKDKIALYADKIEGIFATVFRQAAMFSFEQRSHKARREGGEQTAEQIGEVWQQEIQAMFGDSVKIGDQHRIWWSYVGHFIYAPFYVYAYSFGELLVLSLYQMAKAEGPGFADKYIEVLRLGGSLTPQELMSIVGVDLKSPAFWDGGFAAMEKLVTEFERLWGEYK